MILFPSLGLLFRLELTGRFAGDQRLGVERGEEGVAADPPSLLTRVAIACLIAGFGLLNLANASWAHALGIVCLLGFVLLGFRAIIFTALVGQP